MENSCRKCLLNDDKKSLVRWKPLRKTPRWRYKLPGTMETPHGKRLLIGDKRTWYDGNPYDERLLIRNRDVKPLRSTMEIP